MCLWVQMQKWEENIRCPGLSTVSPWDRNPTEDGVIWQPISPSKPPVFIPHSSTVIDPRGHIQIFLGCWNSNLGSLQASSINQYAITWPSVPDSICGHKDRFALPFYTVCPCLCLGFLLMSPSPFGIFDYQMPANLTCKVAPSSSWLQGALCFPTC